MGSHLSSIKHTFSSSEFWTGKKRSHSFFLFFSLFSSSSSVTSSCMEYNHQRVHPMNSDPSYVNSVAPHPPKYVMLSENSGDSGILRPPPYRRNIPRYPDNHKSKNGCLKCICCCYCILIVLILVLAGVFVYLYFFFQPKVPTYKVEHLGINAFNVQVDFSLYTEFLVNIKAENPNEKISIIYGKDSSIVVAYSGSTLCSGKLPAFHQGYKNITIMNVVLKGKSEFGSGLHEALMENKHTGKIPLNIKVKVPVKLKLLDIPMRQFTVLVNCSLVVDNLSPNKKVGILSSKYDVSVKF